MTFSWKPGFFPYRPTISAQIMGERITALFQERAMIAETPVTVLPKERLLADALPPDSPIHDAFEWDNAIAGHMTRLDQAGAYLRNTVTLEVVPGTRHTRPRKLLIHVTQPAPTASHPKAKTSGYAKVDDAIADHDTLERLIDQWLRDLGALLTRGAALPPLRPLCRAISRLLAAQGPPPARPAVATRGGETWRPRRLRA
jgi:hypothetical protein